jgi:hypothetical protein
MSSSNENSPPGAETEDELFAMFINQRFVDLTMYDQSTLTMPLFPVRDQVYEPVMKHLPPQIYPLRAQELAHKSHVVNPLSRINLVQKFTVPKTLPTPIPHDTIDTHTIEPAVRSQYHDELVCYIDGFNHYRDPVAEAKGLQIPIVPQLPSKSDHVQCYRE